MTARDCKVLALLNYEWFSHYCSCPTIRDWIAVYSALFKMELLYDRACKYLLVGQIWCWFNLSFLYNMAIGSLNTTYYLGNKFGDTFKEKYLHFSLR